MTKYLIILLFFIIGIIFIKCNWKYDFLIKSIGLDIRIIFCYHSKYLNHNISTPFIYNHAMELIKNLMSAVTYFITKFRKGTINKHALLSSYTVQQIIYIYIYIYIHTFNYKKKINNTKNKYTISFFNHINVFLLCVTFIWVTITIRSVLFSTSYILD